MSSSAYNQVGGASTSQTTLAHRTWAVEIGPAGGQGRRIIGLRTVFRVRMSSVSGRSEPSTITMYNATQETISLAQSSTAITRLYAGYSPMETTPRLPQQIAQGQVVPGSVEVTREGPDRVLTWQVKDARIAMTEMLSWSWGTSVRASEIVAWIEARLGLSRGLVRIPPARDVLYRRGYALAGSPSVVLASLAADTGCVWSITDGRLVMAPRGEAVTGGSDLWSAATGLIGQPGPASGSQPGRGQPLLRARVLLRPGCRPGDLIALQTDRINTAAVVQELEHSGDTMGNDWYTEAILRPVQTTIPLVG